MANIGPKYSHDYETNPDLIPSEDFAVLSSPAYAEALVYLANNGGLPVADKATALPYKIVYPIQDDPYRVEGFGYFLQDDHKSYRSEYYDTTKIPYAPMLIRKSEINGKPVFVVFYGFVNVDGTVGVTGHVIFARPAMLIYGFMNPAVQDHGQMLNLKTYGFNEQCLNDNSVGNYTPDVTRTLCNFYLSQEGAELDQMLTTWSETGNLVNKTPSGYRVPFLMTSEMSLPSQ